MAKRLMKRAVKSNSDPYLALLDFMNTPMQGMDASPVQRLMDRRTKTLLPTKESLLVPEIQDSKEQGRKIVRLKERQKHYYNQGAKDPKPLNVKEPVRISPPEGITKTKEWRKGTMTKVLSNRSYEVKSDGQYLRRNRRYLRPNYHQEPVELDDIYTENEETQQPDPLIVPEQMDDTVTEQTSIATDTTQRTVTRSGREVKNTAAIQGLCEKVTFVKIYLCYFVHDKVVNRAQ
jgi:hypothetical protein